MCCNSFHSNSRKCCINPTASPGAWHRQGKGKVSMWWSCVAQQLRRSKDNVCYAWERCMGKWRGIGKFVTGCLFKFHTCEVVPMSKCTTSLSWKSMTWGSGPLRCMAVMSLNLLPALLFSAWRSAKGLQLEGTNFNQDQQSSICIPVQYFVPTGIISALWDGRLTLMYFSFKMTPQKIVVFQSSVSKRWPRWGRPNWTEPS